MRPGEKAGLLAGALMERNAALAEAEAWQRRAMRAEASAVALRIEVDLLQAELHSLRLEHQRNWREIT